MSGLRKHDESIGLHLAVEKRLSLPLSIEHGYFPERTASTLNPRQFLQGHIESIPSINTKFKGRNSLLYGVTPFFISVFAASKFRNWHFLLSRDWDNQFT